MIYANDDARLFTFCTPTKRTYTNLANTPPKQQHLPIMSQTMKALVVQHDHSVRIQDKPKPSASELGPKEVIFKVLAVAQSESPTPGVSTFVVG